MKRILTLVLFLCFVLSGKATSVIAGGPMMTNTSWSVDTVFVTSDVVVYDNVTLTIDPGTRIVFQGFYSISIYGGSIKAVGTSIDMIYFTVEDSLGHNTVSTNTGGWNGIDMNYGWFDSTVLGDSCIFSYCQIEYAKRYTGGGNLNCIRISNRSNVRISNCIITKNNYNYSGSCGGISGSYSSPLILNNTITRNLSFRGGAIHALYQFNPMVRGNIIAYNYASSAGGAIMIQNSPSVVIVNNWIYNNMTDYATCGPTDGGGAIRVEDYSNAYIANNLIANNTSGLDGGGIDFRETASGIPLVENNTIVNNDARSWGGGVYFFESNPVLRNNILWGNTRFLGAMSNQVGIFTDDSDPAFYNNCIEGDSAGFYQASLTYYAGTYLNNNSVDPDFVSTSPSTGSATSNAALYDWSLGPGSNCINNGASPVGALPSVDLAGNPRIVASVIDRGAYEGLSSISVQENSNNNSFNIYPNPTRGLIYVRSEFIREFEFSMTDVSGRLILEGNVKGMSTSIDLSGQESGIYFLRILNTKGEAEVSRIVLQ